MARADGFVSPFDILVAALIAAAMLAATVVAAAVSTLSMLVVVVVALDVWIIAEIIRKKRLDCRVARAE